MAQTNVQAFSGDVELNDRLTINSSVGNIVKKSFTNYNNNASTKYWKVATGDYNGVQRNHVKMNVNTHRVDGVNITRRLVMKADTGNLTFNPCIDEHEPGSSAHDLRVYKNTSTTTFDIYLQIESYSYVDVEISFSGNGITVFDTPTWETSAPTTSATYILEFTNGNLNAMRITNDGNVGIGKTNPGSALDVVGDVAISSNLAVDTNTLFVDSVGNKVGIGTTNPSTLLDLKKDSTNGASIQFESSDGYKTSIGQKSYSTADRAFQFTSYGSSAGDNPVYNFLALNSDENAYNSILTMTGNGNVGIGTTNPIAALDIVGGPANDTTPALAIGGGNHPCSDLYVLNSLDTNTGVGFGAKVIGINIKNKVETDNTLEIRRNDGGLTSAGAIYLGTDDRDQGIFGVLGGDGAPGTTLSEFLTIRATGNVGIGTDSPTDRLDVHYPTPTYGSFTGNEEGSLTVSAGAEYSNAAVYFRTPLNAAAPAKMAIFSSGGSYSGAGTGGLHFCVENTLNNTTKVSLNNSRMVIKGNGNVGIGTVNPSYKLDVNGTVRFTSPWHSSSSITKARYTTSTYFNCIPTNTVTGYISYKVQIRFDPSPGDPPYAAAALVDWFPIGTNTANTNLNIDVYLLTTAHASNGINHSMYVSGTTGLSVGTSGLRCRTASDYYAGTFVTRWYQIGTND